MEPCSQSSNERRPPLALINPPGLYDPTANGYSHVAAVAPGTRLVYLRRGPGRRDRGRTLAIGFRLQVRQALANLRTALAAAGAKVSDVAKLTVLVVDHNLQCRLTGARYVPIMFPLSLPPSPEGRPNPR
jgi:enamine deaminase RidA (YjgF/YER057c/UK114 family)